MGTEYTVNKVDEGYELLIDGEIYALFTTQDDLEDEMDTLLQEAEAELERVMEIASEQKSVIDSINAYFNS